MEYIINAVKKLLLNNSHKHVLLEFVNILKIPIGNYEKSRHDFQPNQCQHWGGDGPIGKVIMKCPNVNQARRENAKDKHEHLFVGESRLNREKRWSAFEKVEQSSDFCEMPTLNLMFQM